MSTRRSTQPTSPDGSTVYVTGLVSNPTSYVDLRTTAYDASTGDVAWSSTFTGPAGESTRVSKSP